MKKLIASFTLVLFLSACATTEPPVTGLARTVQIPELPAELSKKATRLPDIVDPSFGGIIEDGVAVDQQYNSVAYQLNSLIDLYNCVRKSINSDQKQLADCTAAK